MPHRLLRLQQTLGVAALAASLCLAEAASAQAQQAPTSVVPQASSPVAADATTAMRIIAVEWRIKKGQENEFLEYWSTRSTVPDRSGLIGEFMNRVDSREQYPWMQWEFNETWTTFINIGIWREGADFQQQIGRFIDLSRPPMGFEAAPRKRILLAPERWRIGGSSLLKQDHPEVR